MWAVIAYLHKYMYHLFYVKIIEEVLESYRALFFKFLHLKIVSIGN